MASRLDPFFATLFEQLNGQGLSYRTVCNQLLDKGIEISPQALRSWHLRRARKIASRAQQRMHAGSCQEQVIAAAPVQRPAAIAMQSLATAAMAADRKIAKPSQLQSQIEAEERQLLTQQISGQTRYPVRRKATSVLHGQDFFTKAAWLSSKDSK